MGNKTNFDEIQIEKLRDAGLLATLNLEGPYRGGYSIAKPKTAGGNYREGDEGYWGPDLILTDAPSSWIIFKSGKCLFRVWE